MTATTWSTSIASRATSARDHSDTSSPARAAAPELRTRVLARLAGDPAWDRGTSNVHVEGGTVVLQGLFRSTAARLATRRIAEAVPGVHRVWDARVRSRDC